ncbi:phosphotransferase system, EIIC family protein, partial [Vibrio parahaemolyticus V-223/04]
GRLLLVAR